MTLSSLDSVVFKDDNTNVSAKIWVFYLVFQHPLQWVLTLPGIHGILVPTMEPSRVRHRVALPGPSVMVKAVQATTIAYFTPADPCANEA